MVLAFFQEFFQGEGEIYCYADQISDGRELLEWGGSVVKRQILDSQKDLRHIM